MRVFLVTESTKATGLGHVFRCLSLHQAFEERGISPTLVVAGPRSVKSVLGQKNFIRIDWLRNPSRLFRLLNAADIVVLDSYLAEPDVYRSISDRVALPVYLDDGLRLDYPSGIVWNGAIGADRLPYPPSPGRSRLLGCRYALLRRDFWDVPERRVRKKIRQILVTFGGSDSQNMTKPVLERINRVFPRQAKKVIIGWGFKRFRTSRRPEDPSIEFIDNPDGRTMRTLMAGSDVAVSAAGQTLYELARIGVPTVAVGVADNQVHNIRGWENAGFIRFSGWWNHPDVLDSLERNLRDIDDAATRVRMSASGRRRADGQGCRRVVRELITAYGLRNVYLLRKAHERDLRNVFVLSNDPLVRRNSIHQEKIRWADHVRWYTEKIRDPRCEYFVATERATALIGQVRFEIQGRHAVIGISIAAPYRGKGLSSRILNEACFEFFRSRPGVSRIFAYIRPDNESSIKGFERAGFQFAKPARINGERYFLLILEKTGCPVQVERT